MGALGAKQEVQYTASIEPDVPLDLPTAAVSDINFTKPDLTVTTLPQGYERINLEYEALTSDNAGFATLEVAFWLWSPVLDVFYPAEGIEVAIETTDIVAPILDFVVTKFLVNARTMVVRALSSVLVNKAHSTYKVAVKFSCDRAVKQDPITFYGMVQCDLILAYGTVSTQKPQEWELVELPRLGAH